MSSVALRSASVVGGGLNLLLRVAGAARVTVETPAIPERPHTRWWQSRWLHGALSLAVVALIFGFLFPTVADYGEVWNTIQAMTGLEAASLGLVAMWNLASYWPLLTAVQPGLRLREAAVANLASTAISNTLPGGAALGVGATLTMQRSWGIPVADTALAAVVAGIWNNFAKLGLPIVALALLALNGRGRDQDSPWRRWSVSPS